MKKIHMMIAALLAFLPTMLFAGGTAYHYARLTAKVSTNSSGCGMVYADKSTVTSAGTFVESSETKQGGKDCNGNSYTFKVFAQANEGYEFAGWSETDGGTIIANSNVSPWTAPSITAPEGAAPSSGSKEYYNDKTYYANFQKMVLASFNITFETSSAGTYTVDGAAPANKTGLTEATSVVLKSTDANFLNWLVNGTVVNDNPYTATCLADTTISAEFLTADQVTSVTTISDLTAALSNAAYKKIIVPSGTTLTVAKGSTVTVPVGKQLVVDGTLYVDGTLAASGSVIANGNVSKCSKIITQTGVNGQPLNPYGTVRYWKTSSATSSASITGFTGFKTHALIVGGTGTQYRPEITSSSKLIIAVPDSTVAVNHIKSIGSVSTSVNVVNATLNSGMVILLGSDCVINGGLTAKTGFRGVVDCAGFTCKTITSQEVSGNNGKATFLNCPSFTGSKVINITHDYFNCDKVTLSSFNAGGSPILNFYDCGTFSSPASFSASYSKGPTDTSRFNFYSGYYNSLTYKTCFKIYGGSYKSDPATYIADQDGFESVYDSSSKYYFVQEKVNVVNVVSINGTEYATLSDAISAASNGATISLIEAVDLEGGSVTIPAGKNVTIAVDKHTISGGKIVNNGTLLITDATVENEGKIACDIENNGTLDFVFGTYSGAIVNKAGTLTTHNGVFSGTLTMQGGMVALKGGHFTADVSDLVTAEGYHVVKDSDGRFCVCEFPDGTMRPTTVSSAAGYGATPYSDADFTVLYTRVKNGKTERKDYSAEDWMRLAELLCFYQVFYNNGLDATLAFDRDVAKGSINLLAKSTISTSVDFKFDLPAGELYRALSETVVGTYGFYAKTYYSLIDENIKSVAMAVTDKSGNNNGTVCTAMVELWESVRAPDYSSTGHKLTNTVLVVGQQRFTIGAGTNKAMIRPEVGAATFYATVSAAVAEAADGATIMLTQDCEEDVVLAKAGSFTIDQNGFVLTGTVTAGGDYFIEKDEDGTYTVAKKGIVDENGNAQASIQDVVNAAVESEAAEVTITIPETTSEQIVALPEDKTLIIVQAEGSETVVNVTPVDGYFVEATVVEPTEEQSGTTTVYESKKITEEVVKVTEASVQELNVTLEEFQAGSTETNAVEEVAKIVEAVNNLMDNKALERADNVEQAKSETISLKAIVITPKAIVQEVQTSATESEKVVKAAAFDVTPTDVDDNKIENTSFTFRLPVADGMTGSMVVFHEKVFFGVYPILSWSDGAKQHKYIEITSSEFSEYSYEPRRGVEYAVAKIGDVGYDSLEDAVAAAAAGAKVELLASTTLTNEIAVAKAVTLDLGEFTVTAASGKSAIQVVADGNLTVQGTGKIVAESTKFALYTDYELSQGAKTITIKGGVFDGAVQFNKYPLHTSATQSGEAAVPTRVTVDGGTFNGRVSIYHAPFTVNDGTFEQGLDTSDGSVTVYANYKTPVTINGGSFKVRPTPAGSRIVVNGGVYYDNGYFVVGDTAVCQATRNGTYYASLKEAFDNIGPNTVITVLGGNASTISVALELGQSLTVPHPFAGKIAGKGGAALDVTYDNVNGTATYRVRAAGVARIEGTYYNTLQLAFDAAVAGDTITLLGNDTLAFTTLDRAITLDLNGHDVTVTSGAADLSAGALTVVGTGRMTGLVEPSAGKVNLILKGGTYGFNPTKYVPAVIEALPNEKDSLDWNNDRHYVFRNAAFVDGYWTADSGVWTVVPVPKAYVSRITEQVNADAGAPLDAAYTFNSFNPANGDSAIADKVITGDGQLNLNALTDPSEIARALVVLQEAMPFLGWHADFAVSFDKSIAAGSLTLAGQYNGWSSSWVSYPAPNAVAANVIRRLLVDEGGASVDDWSYEHICTKVKVFNCGARMDAASLSGVTMKVQLRLYAPETDEGTGSPSIGICEYKYTFGGKAARIDDTLYDTIDAAIAQVESNDVVVVLNDYTGAVDLNSCDKPFTVNRNGFVLAVTATNNVNAGSDWHFDRLSNGSWSYYNKPAPKTAEEAVVMVEVVDEQGEAVSLSVLTPTQAWLDEKTEAGETSAEQAVTKVEENGLQAWQNYVLGQDPSAEVRVDTAQAPIDNTPVANTLTEKVNVPANSGFKVSYELDKVEVDGTVVEGTPKDTADDFTIDLESATDNEAGAAYFKMTAVIEAEDGTGAKTKVASENTIGVLKVDSSNTNTVIAVPWASLSDDKDISVSNLVRTATLHEGDKLYAYDASAGKFMSWTLDENKMWQPAKTASAGSDVMEAPAASVQTIPRGSGVWLTRTDTTQPIYLVGGATAEVATTPLERAKEEGKPSWNIVASPSVEPVDIADVAVDGDQVIVPTKGAPKNYTMKDGQWGYWTTETVTKTIRGVETEVIRSVFKTDDTTVPAGTGFWYLNSSTDDGKEIDWK